MIEQQTLEKIATLVAEHGVEADVVPALRNIFPQIHFTFCSDDDVIGGPQPVHESEQFNIYLVDSRDHCMTLTNDLEVASGILITEVMAEDEL